MFKIGFTCGSYDLLHAGHCLALKECKKQCDFLIVGLQTDQTIDRPTKNKPIQSVKERYTQLKSCRYVDKVIKYTTEKQLVELLKDLKPDIRFMGEDWKGKNYTGKDLPIRVVFTSRKHNYSSTNLRKRIFKHETRRSLKDFDSSSTKR